MTLGPLKRATTATWYGKTNVKNPRDALGRRQVVGDGMIGRFDDMTHGDLDDAKARGSRRPGRPGVRAPIVARMPGNSGGAKGRRKVET
jgi:hypothetical protein